MTERFDIALRAARAGLTLPPPPTALGSYVPHLVRGGAGVLSGQFPLVDGEMRYPGLLGVDVTVPEGRAAARLAAINVLAQLDAAVGGRTFLGLLRVDGYVASAPGFTEQPSVLEGASELLEQVLGEEGRHARSAVATPALPLRAPVELVVSFVVG